MCNTLLLTCGFNDVTGRFPTVLFTEENLESVTKLPKGTRNQLVCTLLPKTLESNNLLPEKAAEEFAEKLAKSLDEETKNKCIEIGAQILSKFPQLAPKGAPLSLGDHAMGIVNNALIASGLSQLIQTFLPKIPQAAGANMQALGCLAVSVCVILIIEATKKGG